MFVGTGVGELGAKAGIAVGASVGFGVAVGSGVGAGIASRVGSTPPRTVAGPSGSGVRVGRIGAAASLTTSVGVGAGAGAAAGPVAAGSPPQAARNTKAPKTARKITSNGREVLQVSSQR